MDLYVGAIKYSLHLSDCTYQVDTLYNQSLCDVLSATFTVESAPRKTKVTLIVTSTITVTSLKVANKAGRQENITIINSTISDNIKIWEVQMTTSSTGTQTFTVTGYGTDGTSGASATASIKVTR